MKKQNEAEKVEVAAPHPDDTVRHEDETPDSVNKIRDIIFGANMRDYEKKFTRLEERFARETLNLRTEMTQGFTRIEELIKGGMDGVTEAQKTEKDERTAALSALSANLKDAVEGLKTEAARSAEQTTVALRKLGQLVHDESQRLGQDLAQKHANLVESHDQDARELRAMLTDRFALAELFSEVAGRLKNGSKPS